jgi:signal transduction histidine kinase/CheY-like chemotaxis protein
MYAAGIDPGLHSSPLSVDLKNFPTTTVWPLAKVAHSGHAQALDCSGQLFEDLPERPWQARPQKAKVMPVILPGQVLPSMLLVLAISPRRVFDDAYQNFFDLIASQIGSTLADALAYEQEKKRAEALMELDRAKTAFFSNVSHEFRTPLNAMFGWARLLSERRLDEETIARGLKSIGQNAKAQAQLIEDLLDVSRIISGKFRLKVEPVQVAPVIEAAIDSIRPAADAKGVRIQFSSDHDAGPVSGDAGRIQQVVWNLLSNAVKFTPNGGRVEVRLSRAGSHVEIEVSDTGQGIGAEFLPFVFDRFRQADGSTTRTHGGLGLGLAIVRHIAELHGGSVAANSPGIGHGAIFTVRLPLMTIEKKPSDAKSAVPSVTNEVAPASAHTQSLEGVKVLIVDDDLEALLLLSTALTHSGAYVKTASSVEEGFTHVKEWRPDVIVSDIAMPSEDGYSFIKRVRAWSSGDGGWIPAVALTAYARAEDRMKAIDSGYQIHVPKPVEPLELITAVASLIGQHRDHTPAGDPGQDGS